MDEINLKVDGQAVRARRDQTILDVARTLGIRIPTLCQHDQLAPYGACRLCLVEIRRGKSSRLVASCGYYVEEGLEILTDSERVRKVRGLLLELLLSMMPHSREVQALAREYGVTVSRYQRPLHYCILCGLCVRYCEEVKGSARIGYVGRGVDREVAWIPLPDSFDACLLCSDCHQLCPTGVFPSNWGIAQNTLLHR
jgi:bidirectional [NiFe] hydrogenase diaphorase subunit